MPQESPRVKVEHLSKDGGPASHVGENEDFSDFGRLQVSLRGYKPSGIDCKLHTGFYPMGQIGLDMAAHKTARTLYSD